MQVHGEVHSMSFTGPIQFQIQALLGMVEMLHLKIHVTLDRYDTMQFGRKSCQE